MSNILQKYKNILILFILIWSSIVFYKMIGRSVWVDEGMVLKSIFQNSIFDFINPLPYYDQAQPFLVSVFHKIITTFSIDYQFIRAFSLIFCLIPILYVVIKIAKNENIELYIIFLVLFSTVLSVGFYLTEIKHYSFEIIATFGIIYCFNNYIKEIYKYKQTIIFIALISMIGFSSIIPAAITIAYLSIFELIKQKKEFFTIKNITAIIITSAILLVVYLHMKHLTIFQISNHDVYLSKGILSDIKSLIGSSLGAYGKVFIILSALSSIITLFYVNKKSFLFHLNILFLIIVVFVTLAKLIGIYPVISDRHIVWIVPFSIFIVALFLQEVYKSEKKIFKIISIIIFILLFLQVVNIIYKTYTTELKERTANNKLYEFVGNMEPSLFVVHPWGKPSLDYYKFLLLDLNKHKYLDGNDNKKSKLNLKMSSQERYKNAVDDVFNEVKENNFYFLISHLKSIDDTNQDIYNSIGYVKEKLYERNCVYKSIFKEQNVQILEVECKNATNPKP